MINDKGKRDSHEYNENDSEDSLGRKHKYRDPDEETRKPSRGTLFDNDYSVHPTTNRRAAQYSSHEIDQLEPASQSSETTTEQKERLKRNDYHRQQRKRNRRARLVIGVGIAIIALVIAFVAGTTVYLANFDSSLSDGLDADVSNSLVATENDDDARFVLIVGLDDDGSGSYLADTLMLAYIAPANKTVSLISIPNNTRVYLDGKGYCALEDARAIGGQKLMVDTVSDLLDVKITDYYEADVSQFNDIVDVLGGVSMDVPINTNVGGVSVDAGTQLLDSTKATVVSRCWSSYSKGLEQRMLNQNALLSGILEKLLTASSMKTVPILNSLADSLTTDLTHTDLINLKNSLSGATVHTGVLPHTSRTVSGVNYSILDHDGWSTMYADLIGDDMDAFDALSDTTSSEAFDPSSWSVMIRNGSGVKGVATQAADKLTKAGFAIQGTGNADQFVYNETLVVYNDDSDITAVRNVIAALGVGRAVQNTGSYTYDGDILVVVGNDWVPE